MRKRSAYKPRAALVNPLTLLEPLNKDQQQALLLRCYSALNSMTQGAKAEPNDWRDIADDLRAVLVVERIAGRPDDDRAMLNRVLDARYWERHE